MALQTPTATMSASIARMLTPMANTSIEVTSDWMRIERLASLRSKRSSPRPVSSARSSTTPSRIMPIPMKPSTQRVTMPA